MNAKTLQECVNYFLMHGVYAYAFDKKVFVDIESANISVEISKDEILSRAEIYRETKDKVEQENLFKFKELAPKKKHI